MANIIEAPVSMPESEEQRQYEVHRFIQELNESNADVELQGDLVELDGRPGDGFNVRFMYNRVEDRTELHVDAPADVATVPLTPDQWESAKVHPFPYLARLGNIATEKLFLSPPPAEAL